MRTKDLVRVMGSRVAIAQLLGITQAAISQWGDSIPELRRFQLLEKLPSLERKIRALKNDEEHVS